MTGIVTANGGLVPHGLERFQVIVGREDAAWVTRAEPAAVPPEGFIEDSPVPSTSQQRGEPIHATRLCVR